MGFRFISHVLQHGQLSIFLILILVGNLFFFLDPNLLFPTVTSVFFLSSSFGPVLLHLYMLSGTLRQNMDCCHLGKNKIRISGSVKHTGINILKQPNLSSLRVLLNCHYLVKSPSTNWFCKILPLETRKLSSCQPLLWFCNSLIHHLISRIQWRTNQMEFMSCTNYLLSNFPAIPFFSNHCIQTLIFLGSRSPTSSPLYTFCGWLFLGK